MSVLPINTGGYSQPGQIRVLNTSVKYATHVSHMGAGGKTDPTQVRVSNMEQLSGCKLGAHIKKRMKRKHAS